PCVKPHLGSTEYKRGSRDCSRPMAGSPRIIARPTIRSRAACRRARVRQGQAFGGAEEAPSLTATARDGDGNVRSGWKNARGAGRTKKWSNNARQKWRDAPLTKKAPYKRRPLPPLRATSTAMCGRDGRMLAARVEQKNGVTTRDKNGVMLCGKAARTDLGGGRAMKRTSLPLLRRRDFITLLDHTYQWKLLSRSDLASQRPAVCALISRCGEIRALK